MLPREITCHKVNGLNEAITIAVMDGPGPGGASHYYRVEPIATDHPQGAINPVEIRFQDGPIQESGVNGVSNEALIAVVIDRLQSFQKGSFACRENALALTKLEEAMHWLHHRTRERLARGVEGTNQK
jgi:hypothetical protein